MTSSEAEAYEAGMSLPSEARKRLAIQLLESVDVVDDEPVDGAWTAEISSRVDDIRSGKVQTVSHDDVMGRLAERRAVRQAARQHEAGAGILAQSNRHLTSALLRSAECGRSGRRS